MGVGWYSVEIPIYPMWKCGKFGCGNGIVHSTEQSKIEREIILW